jgi:hypothetical protein
MFRSTADAQDQRELEMKLGQYEIGTFTLEKSEKGWIVMHRDVQDMYKGQGAASVLLHAVEEFVQEQSNKSGETQEISISIGQPNVLSVFLSKGYEAATREDQRRIDMIMSGDESLVLDYSHTRNGMPLRHKDIYVFEKDVTERTEKNAFRVNLIKKVKPKSKVVGEIGKDTSADVQQALDQSA